MQLRGIFSSPHPDRVMENHAGAQAILPSGEQSQNEKPTPAGCPFDLAAILLASYSVFVVLILWLDNAQGITGNGIFKSITVKNWVADPANTRLAVSNYLYFPVMALLAQLLDLLGVFVGDPRRQLTVIDSFCAALCLCIVYLLVRQITRNRAVAWAAVLFHLAGAFFLNLAISNEDIMPSYMLLFASMALASVWFVQPTWRRVVIVAFLFTLAWMFEWRLMFPTLPGMILALAASQGRFSLRVGWIALFLGTMVAVAQVAVLLWGPHHGNAASAFDLLWTGKGVDEGWAGFSVPKISYLWVGITQYLAGGANIGDLSQIHSLVPEMLATTVLLVVIAGLSLFLLWRDRKSPQIRAVVFIFGTTFAAGEVMNLYSQPQDPQMQINVMLWLTVGWAMIVAAARWRPNLVVTAAIAFSLALFSYNVWRIAPLRGSDTVWQLALKRIEREADPDRTVFLVHGFEQSVSERFYAWDGDWEFFSSLGPAPTSKPKFKFLALVSGPVHKPRSSGIDLANDLRGEINRAMDLGYEIVMDDFWGWSPSRFEAAMATVANAEQSAAIYRMLHEYFVATLAFTDPVAGPHYLLRRSSKSQ